MISAGFAALEKFAVYGRRLRAGEEIGIKAYAASLGKDHKDFSLTIKTLETRFKSLLLVRRLPEGILVNEWKDAHTANGEEIKGFQRQPSLTQDGNAVVDYVTIVRSYGTLLDVALRLPELPTVTIRHPFSKPTITFKPDPKAVGEGYAQYLSNRAKEMEFAAKRALAGSHASHHEIAWAEHLELLNTAHDQYLQDAEQAEEPEFFD